MISDFSCHFHQVPQEVQRFYLFGVLCGLALYNQVIVHLPFPLVLFKKLLGVKPSVEDMMEFSPSVGKQVKINLNHTDLNKNPEFAFNKVSDFQAKYKGMTGGSIVL